MKRRISIRTKILLPFIGIIVFLVVTALFLIDTFMPGATGRGFFVATACILALVCLAIFGIYAVIIRNITSSLDILSSVAEKVSQGDLDQHIYVATRDEVGELSAIFNQMVLNLKESASRLLHEKNQSEAIISNIPEGILVMDREYRLILANKRAEKMLMISFSALQGRSFLENIPKSGLWSAFKEELQSEKRQWNREVSVSLPLGGDRIYSISSTVVTSRVTEESIGVVSVLRDITHEKELEALRDSFLRTVSHELRTPLTSIMGFIDLVLGGGKVEEEQKKYLKIALDEAVNLKVLIDDLLDLSRMEAGRMELVYSTVNVKGLFDNLVSLLSPLARGKNLELVSVVTDEKLETTLDAAKIRRILVNLITNAIKFTEKGTISLRCRLQKKEKEMEFAVSDTGIGLMDDEKEFIFERFRQVDDSSTRKYEGIGLGLSIVKQLVEMHKGRIWVESQYGKGSTFYFAIPL